MKTIPNAPAIYNADIYLRLSRDDDNKGESNSIVNQKELIKNFLKSKPEIKVNDIKVDDGYTGVNFDRPAFIEMLSEIRSGKVNCVVVKDMSRFGRNYIEVGKYITDVFPFLGVRFIAINDNIDTALTETSSELTIFHFKNLLNDAYCNDISIKVRSQLDIKRKNGDFIGSFAPYGYLKSADNKNKLVVDESVRSVIEEIFNLKISGYSALRIADKLNECGIASPMEHKKELGEKFNTVFRKNAVTKWDANSVLRILKNKVYIGTL
ncbi:MAG: recombinase family protein, partial [Firmicutes bacterium]|nr:recombinase family protein [Bacillota bacterium]